MKLYSKLQSHSNQIPNRPKMVNRKSQWHKYTEFIIFSHCANDAKLTDNFITYNHLKILKIKASPDLNNFLYTFQANSYDNLLKIWSTFKNTYKFQKHTYVRPSYTEELRLKELQNAKQNITALTYTALNQLLSVNNNHTFKKAFDYITTQLLFKNENSITTNLNQKQLQSSITKYPFTRILFPNITQYNNPRYSNQHPNMLL